jgi:hypothetical protein
MMVTTLDGGLQDQRLLGAIMVTQDPTCMLPANLRPEHVKMGIFRRALGHAASQSGVGLLQ